MTTAPQRAVRQLLDLTVWTAFDIDAEGRLLVGSDEAGSTQLVEIDSDGTRRLLTELPTRCSGRYLPGTRQVVVEHDDDGNENMQLSVLDLSDAPELPVALPGLTPLVRCPGYMNALLDVTSEAVVYSTNRRNGVDMDVVAHELDTGHEEVVYDSGGYVGSALASHDARSVVVTRLSGQPHSTVLSLSGPGGSRDITAPDEHALHRCLGFDTSDTGVVVVSNHDREYQAIQRIAAGEWHLLVEDAGHDLTGWLAPDGSAMAVATNVDGAFRLALHEPDGRLRCPADVPADGVIDVVWADDGSRLLVSTSRPDDPGSLWRVDATTGAAEVLLDARAALPARLRDDLSPPELHRVPTSDGEQVPCFVHRPHPSGDAALAGACVVVVHGGPEAQSQRSFGPMTQALCLTGFTVVVPNVRGSTGYGKRWYSLDDVELRLDSVADLASIHSWLPAIGLDPSRAALWGGSYGGYMVLAGVTMQPDLWAAGVDIVGMSSLVTFLENTSDYRRAAREREYGTLAHHRELLLAASPITHLDRLRAPLFVIHGANDPRVPLSEAEQVVEALEQRGIRHELRVYDDEGHGLAKRPNRIDAYTGAVDFLVERLRDTDQRRSRPIRSRAE